MINKKIIFLVALSQIIGLFCFGQSSFEISYSTGRNDQARAIVQTLDSGFAVVGSTVSYEGNTDVYLMKTDRFGTFQWAKRFGKLGMEGGRDIVETQDGGLAILGYGQKNGVYDMYFIKTDKNGDSLFTKFIGEIDWDFGNALNQTPDKGYILAGETFKTGESKGYLVKLDSNGNTEWKKTFGTTLSTKFEDILIARNGDYVLAGESESFGNGRQVYFVRTDSAGNLLWEKNYGNPGIDFAKSITQISTGDFVFAGGTNTSPFTDIDNWAGKIDSLGNMIQNSTIIDYTPSGTTVHNDEWNETVVKYNDSLVFAGRRSYDNSEPGNIYIYRYTNDIGFSGYQSDYQKFISNHTESAYDAKMTFDNGVIFACSGEFMDTSESNIYLIKMDSTMTYPHPFYNSVSTQNDYTSLSEKVTKKEFAIYPNPSNGLTTIKLDKFKNDLVTIRMIDAYGKLIFTSTTSDLKYKLDISNYNSGMYFVTVSSVDFVTTKRLLISN